MCEQGTRPQTKDMKKLHVEPTLGSNVMMSDSTIQMQCNNPLCNTRNLMSNILCEFCRLRNHPPHPKISSMPHRQNTFIEPSTLSQHQVVVKHSQHFLSSATSNNDLNAEWVCLMCSYSNDNYAATCTMCHTGTRPYDAPTNDRNASKPHLSGKSYFCAAI